MKTGVAPVRSFVTTTLVKAMLPALLIVPLKVSVPPGLTGLTGQVCVTMRRGFVPSVQVAVAVLETTTRLQMSLPLAFTVLLTEQTFVGAVKVAVKLVDAPGARLGTVKTVVGDVWRSVTTMLVSVTLPEFRTVPV